MSEDNTNPGDSDDAEDKEEAAGEFVNEITPTNMPEPIPDPSWSHDDDDEAGETNKPDADS